MLFLSKKGKPKTRFSQETVCRKRFKQKEKEEEIREEKKLKFLWKFKGSLKLTDGGGLRPFGGGGGGGGGGGFSGLSEEEDDLMKLFI